MNRCMGCMRIIDSEDGICPHCGYVVGTPQQDERFLQIGSVLMGRYIIGKALGNGGFGITYIAWDSMLEKVVTIKEYFPSGFVTRSQNGVSVKLTDIKMKEQFENGRRKAIEESRCLAKLDNIENVADVFDCFEENNTAYIIMEYLDGITLKDLLNKEGVLSYERALNIIIPVINSLGKVHQKGLIHRDISPDNIFICKDGQIKILDFGSARYAMNQNEKTYTIVLKHGYAPVEQYSSGTSQGTWTDVYATAATLYKMITGLKPVDSIERVANDTLRSPKELHVNLPDYADDAIMRALCVDSSFRTQTMQEFKRGLSGFAVRQTSYKDEMYKDRPVQEYKPNYESSKKSNKTGLWIGLIAIAVAVVVIAALVLSQKEDEPQETTIPTVATTVEQTTEYTTVEQTTEEETTEEETTVQQPKMELQIAGEMTDSVTVAYAESASLIIENMPDDAGNIMAEVEDEDIVSVKITKNIFSKLVSVKDMSVTFIAKNIGQTTVKFYLENYPDVCFYVTADVILALGSQGENNE